MKKYILIFLLFLNFVSFAQEEKDSYEPIVSKFQSFYNQAKYDSIFNLFDDTMKKAMPLNVTNSFFKQNVSPLGQLKKMSFYDTKKTAHIYKSDFEHGIYDIFISLNNENQINGFFIKQSTSKKAIKRNTTKMILPFNEEWFVFWGGNTVENNYHVAYENQKGAYDLVIQKNGQSFKNDRSKNEHFYAFGKEVISPCDGKIVKIIDHIKDNIPGEMNPKNATGNTIILETVNNEFILFAHLKENSIVVNEGQQVKQRDVLGLCGNSGNSSEPHLHLSLQNLKTVYGAIGGKLFFEEIKVNGSVKKDYIPVKNEKIKNIK